MIIIIFSLIFLLVLNILYKKVTAKFNYDPAEECAIGLATGDTRMATIGLIKTAIVTMLLAALIKYSLLAVIELAIVILKFMGVE